MRLSAAREVYRPVAANGALLYFLINNLHELDRVYHFSMANFVAILGKGAASCKVTLSPSDAGWHSPRHTQQAAGCTTPLQAMTVDAGSCHRT